MQKGLATSRIFVGPLVPDLAPAPCQGRISPRLPGLCSVIRLIPDVGTLKGEKRWFIVCLFVCFQKKRRKKKKKYHFCLVNPFNIKINNLVELRISWTTNRKLFKNVLDSMVFNRIRGLIEKKKNGFF